MIANRTLFLEELAVRINRGVPWGWKKNPEESEDHQNVNPGVSKVEISWGTPGFGVFEEPFAIPTTYHLWGVFANVNKQFQHFTTLLTLSTLFDPFCAS